MSVRRVLAVASSLVLLLIFGATAPASAAPSAHYYLSLGDSLAYGYQPNLMAQQDYNPADYVGYAEDFAAMHPGLTLVNYGCPGETTSSMLGIAPASTNPANPLGCYSGDLSPAVTFPRAMLHDPYGAAADQAAAAYAFLAAHGSQTSLITIDIGSNDLLALISSCAGSESCILGGLSGALQTMGANYAKLLGTITALAPNAHIVLYNYYDPYAGQIPHADLLASSASTVVQSLASSFSGAGYNVSVADAFSSINHTSGSPSERAFVCSRTWMCTAPYYNIHPTTLGYRMLAVALQHAVS